ncbi:insulinase family protein [Streptomyces sp. NPDC006649]|uniref:M16 family metallopeptidase n=1 Tax=Streptomyces sp. NPDC006649 TaxID=3156896 RepID=UPI0033A558C4
MVQAHLALPVHPADGPDLAATEVLAASLLHRSPAASLLEDAGGSLNTSRRGTWLGVSATGPAAQLSLLMEALAQTVLDAGYSAADIDAGRGRVIQQAHLAAAQPAVISQQALLDQLYRSCPVSLRANAHPAHVEAITTRGVAETHQRLVRPQQALMVIVGDLAPQLVIESLEESLATWKPGGCGQLVSPDTSPLAGTRSPRIVRVHQPGWVQSHVRLAAQGLPREDPRFAALSLASVAFGGYFSSRLVTVLREELGLAYRVESSFHDHIDHLLIGIEVDTATAGAGRAVEQVNKQLEQFANDGPSPRETAAAMRYMTGVSALSVASQSGVAATLMGNLTLGRPLDWLETLTAQLRDTTAHEVRAAAGAFYTPERFQGVLVGDVNDGFERSTQ